MTAYILNLLVLISVYAILSTTLNFIIGYAGIFSLAHAVFFGIGGYTAALVAMNVTPEFFVAVPIAMGAAAVTSLLLALPALRVRGEYFVAASLGLQVLAVTLFSEWKSFTGGIGGVIGIPAVELFGYPVYKPWQFLLMSMICLVTIIAITRTLVHTSFGRSLKALRDSESAALASGKNITVIKTLSVVLSSSLAAAAGALYAFYMSFINVESFMLDTSVLVMAMVIIGGTATIWGPLLGAALLMLIPSALTYLSFLPQTEIGSIQQIVYGLAMVLLMIFRPGGIVSSQPGGSK